MSTFEEIRPEFEISSKVESVARYAFEGIDPLQDSGVVVASGWWCLLFSILEQQKMAPKPRAE